MGIGVELPIPFGWHALAYCKDLQPGDVSPTFLFDLRTENGEARMLEAFCPHLGAQLGHGGKVMGDRIACPFHPWELDGDGVVRNIPYAGSMPRRTQEAPCLHSYPVQERNQMTWPMKRRCDWLADENIMGEGIRAHLLRKRELQRKSSQCAVLFD